MNTIKEIRQQMGYTQAELVAVSGLSLRTIQRSEADVKAPKGHSLKMLAKAFNLTPMQLQEKFAEEADTSHSDAYAIKVINLGVLAFFLIPFGNIFVPFFLWRKYHKSSSVDKMGRRIINFQILWTLMLISSLTLSPFINRLVLPSHPLILYALFLCLAVNVIVVILTARAIQRDKMDFLRPLVALI